MTRRTIKRNHYDHEILMFQGGGALGSFQAGVYEALSKAGMMPTWVVGISIGAINATIIAGNPPERRIERLREFWYRVSEHSPLIPPQALDPIRPFLERLSVVRVIMSGVQGFFQPRVPFPLLAPSSHPDELSFYDTSPLERTLEELVDFDFLNCGKTRLSLGAVKVRTGESTYFDTLHTRITARHVMASGALPPAFPAVEIDGEEYWDGGLVSNTPLTYVLDQKPLTTVLLVQANLFPVKGEYPRDMMQVMERIKDIQYSSKQRFNTEHLREVGELRAAMGRLLAKLPSHLKDDPDVIRIREQCDDRNWTIAFLTDSYHSGAGQWKDAEFSRATVEERWAGGIQAIRRSLANREWMAPLVEIPGVRIFDLPPRQTGEKAVYANGKVGRRQRISSRRSGRLSRNRTSRSSRSSVH